MTIRTKNAPYGCTLPIGLHVLDTAKAIALLKKLKCKGVDALEEPLTMLSEEIDTIEQVFQARTGKLNERHLGELEGAIKTHGTLDPLILWRCGAYAILLEGHHRLEAYQRADITKGQMTDIPVTWFRGSVEEAVVKAGAANSRAKLQMSHAERSNHAWKMVKTEMFKVAEVVDATTISKRTVITMRGVADKLGEEASTCESWQKALMLLKGQVGWDPDEAEALAEQLSQEFAERLLKNFGSKLVQNSEITAKAFYKHFNRQSAKIISDWMSEAGIEPEDLSGDDE